MGFFAYYREMFVDVPFNKRLPGYWVSFRAMTLQSWSCKTFLDIVVFRYSRKNLCLAPLKRANYMTICEHNFPQLFSRSQAGFYCLFNFGWEHHSSVQLGFSDEICHLTIYAKTGIDDILLCQGCQRPDIVKAFNILPSSREYVL